MLGRVVSRPWDPAEPLAAQLRCGERYSPNCKTTAEASGGQTLVFPFPRDSSDNSATEGLLQPLLCSVLYKQSERAAPPHSHLWPKEAAVQLFFPAFPRQRL